MLCVPSQNCSPSSHYSKASSSNMETTSSDLKLNSVPREFIALKRKLHNLTNYPRKRPVRLISLIAVVVEFDKHIYMTPISQATPVS